ncbi:MAG: phospholipase C [Acidiferrobacter sp.]
MKHIMSRRQFLKGAALAAATPLLESARVQAALRPGSTALSQHIDHIIVIFQENRSFDHYFGSYRHPRQAAVTNLLDNAGHVAQRFAGLQKDPAGIPYTTLPVPDNIPGFYRAHLPNMPFSLAPYVSASENVPWDPGHRFFRMAAGIHNGRMDRFVALAMNHKAHLSRRLLRTLPAERLAFDMARPSGPVLGFYERQDIPFYHQLADEYVLFDHFFQAAMGGSTTNALYLVSARSCQNPSAPEESRSPYDPRAVGLEHAFFDLPYDKTGTLINDLPPIQGPTSTNRKTLRLSPPPQAQTYDNIGDRLSAAGVSWAWYNENWNLVKSWALKDAFGPGEGSAVIDSGQLYVAHHNPFQYYPRWPQYVHEGRMRGVDDFLEDAASGRLPHVAFLKATAAHDEHPADCAPRRGMDWVHKLLAAVAKSPAWGRTAVFVTYDEGGGFWDQMAPPQLDAYGLGTRIPALLVSPYARQGHVDHHLADTSSILKLIETRFRLSPLTHRDARAYDLVEAFDFQQKPREPVALLT